MSTERQLSIDDDGVRKHLYELSDSTFERFHAVRRRMNARNDREVDNEEVLSLLLDVWEFHDGQDVEVADGER